MTIDLYHVLIASDDTDNIAPISITRSRMAVPSCDSIFVVRLPLSLWIFNSTECVTEILGVLYQIGQGLSEGQTQRYYWYLRMHIILGCNQLIVLGHTGVFVGYNFFSNTNWTSSYPNKQISVMYTQAYNFCIQFSNCLSLSDIIYHITRYMWEY